MAAASEGVDAGAAVGGQNGDAPVAAGAGQPEKREKPVRKALLKNDDRELDRVQQVRR